MELSNADKLHLFFNTARRLIRAVPRHPTQNSDASRLLGEWYVFDFSVPFLQRVLHLETFIYCVW